MMATSTSAGSGYPVRLTIDSDQRVNRLWGIPFLGIALRWFLLIPHWFVIGILAIVASLALIVSWIPILLLGRLPDWIFNLNVMTYRWATRVTAYALLMTGPYPPFSLSTPYPVDLIVDAGGSINRLWGIPFLGALARSILVIPHVIVLVVLSIALYFVLLVIWIPVLLNGRFPKFGYDLFGGYLRLTARASLWTFLMPFPYPPIVPGE